MALKGIRVLELAGLAPGPYCGMILSDFGASVTRIDRTVNNRLDCLGNGKTTLPLNLKSTKAQTILRKLVKKSDVIIEPFRPGVMENLGLGPDVLMKDNPRLIYARLTGFGQTGPLSARAGHDINYVAVSGVLSFLGEKDSKPKPPVNLLADFAGGGLLCAFGICVALLERSRSGKGQVIDHSMTEGSAYVASWLMRSQQLPIWGKARGDNILDGGSFFYDTYETKDNKFMSVGALEPQFFKEFIKGLELEIGQFDENETAKILVGEKFKTKTQKEWIDIFEDTDACVFPVVEWEEAKFHRQNRSRQSFVENTTNVIPTPAPILSRTPAKSSVLKEEAVGECVESLLKEIGVDKDEIKELCNEGVLLLESKL
ncbi:Alpha-methylacyl-CoA racemase [Pseudolycoriella hygida]|uniref:Alpha-methylacyl-CoA racemase n=1 Tax=Pseudolycoriella hygida TaxID=35572 RepID=A0A9Q0NCR3_9DIPT|nr:Alpha-methylacyl-CoA racemase [Pseudolycoriella hygida]